MSFVEDMADEINKLLRDFARLNRLREKAGKKPLAESTLGIYSVGDAAFLARLTRRARIHPDIIRKASAWTATEIAGYSEKRKGRK